MKMYVWTDRFSYLAVAHAESVAEARKAMLIEMGESGDGSCPERDKARKCVMAEMPAIYIGTNAEFALTDSAELRELEVLVRRHEADLLSADRKARKECREEFLETIRRNRSKSTLHDEGH